MKYWRGCKGTFEVLEIFFTIIIPRELCGFFEKLDDRSGLFDKFGKKSGYGGEATY